MTSFSGEKRQETLLYTCTEEREAISLMLYCDENPQ